MDKCVKCGGTVIWQACDKRHLFCDPCWHEYISLYGEEFDTNGDIPCPICVKDDFGGGVLVPEVDLQIHFSFMELIRQRDGTSPMEDRKRPYPLSKFKEDGTEWNRLLSRKD